MIFIDVAQERDRRVVGPWRVTDNSMSDVMIDRLTSLSSSNAAAAVMTS